MKAKVSILGILMMAFLIITGVVHAAPVEIDSFAVEAQSLTVASGDLTDSGVTANNGAILGGERDAYLELLGGDSTSNLDINAGGGGIVAFSAGSGSDLKAIIVWDGDDDDPDPTTGLDYTGLGGQDLTAGGTNDGIALTIYDWEGNALDIVVTIYTDASNYSSTTLALRGGGQNQISPPGEIYGLAFDDDFATGSGASGSADFTDVGAIVLEIVTVATGADVSMDLALATATRDFGDLPADYGITTVANNGARHTQDAVYLGTVLDTEVDGTTSSGADGDDLANNDEEGVTRSGAWTEGAAGGTVQFTITSPHFNEYACVDGWIDWNDDNDFDDASEHVIDSTLLFNLGFVDNFEQSFDIPVGGLSHSVLYSRWRIAPDIDGDGNCADEVNMSYTGHVSGGEVEDYQWVLTPSAVTMGNFNAHGNASMIPPALVAMLLLVVVGSGAVVFGRQRIR